MQLFNIKYKDCPTYSCIYKITCTSNNKFYIGSTISFRKRVKDHKNDLLANKHASLLMQRCFNNYGKDCFEIEILKSFERIIPFKSTDYKEVLLKTEEEYITKYSPEFNTQLHPYSDFGVFKDIENPVYQYDLDGNFIKKWKNAAEVEHTLGFQIGNGLRNQSAGKFQWRKEYFDKIPKYKSNSGEKERKECSLYDLYGKKIKTFKSIADLTEYIFPGLDKKELYKKRNFINIRIKTTKGFFNKYRIAYGCNDQLDNSVNKNWQRGFILVEYTLNGNPVNIWESLTTFNKTMQSNPHIIIINNEICYKYKDKILKRL